MCLHVFVRVRVSRRPERHLRVASDCLHEATRVGLRLQTLLATRLRPVQVKLHTEVVIRSKQMPSSFVGLSLNVRLDLVEGSQSEKLDVV